MYNMNKSTEDCLQNTSGQTRFQTLLLKINSNIPGGSCCTVSVLLDSGSQCSYIDKTLIKTLRFKCICTERLSQGLFGGFESGVKNYNVHSNVKILKMNLNA